MVAILATAMVAAAEVGAGSEREAARAARSAAAPVALVATVAVSAAMAVAATAATVAMAVTAVAARRAARVAAAVVRYAPFPSRALHQKPRLPWCRRDRRYRSWTLVGPSQ